MQKIEVVVRITKDHCPPQEQTIFEWFDLVRNPTDALSRPDLEINLEHHRVFKHGTEVYMSRYEYGVLSLMAQHPGKLFTKEQIFEAVWHKDSESYLRAVTSTIGRIRQKIEDDKDHPRYIKTVSNIGYPQTADAPCYISKFNIQCFCIYLTQHIEKRGILCALSSLRMSSFPSP